MLITPIDASEPVLPPRAKGCAVVTARVRGTSTVLDGLRQEGSLKLLFPRHVGPMLQAVTLNTAGGVTGGDCFDLKASAADGASLCITTQAAERIYQAAQGATGAVTARLEAGQDATLHWLPQETILFDGAALDRHLSVHLCATSRFVGVETLVFGREAMGEDVTRLDLRDRCDVYVDGKLEFADRLRLTGDAKAALARAAVAKGARAMASIVLAGPDVALAVDDLRALLGESGGVTAFGDTLVFLRVLAPDSFALRQCVVPILNRVSGAELPKTWMI